MKRLTLLFSICCLSMLSFAQNNYYKFSVGAGAGGAMAFADLNKKKISFAGYATVDYHFTPYVTLGLEGQKGELAGGDILFDPYNRQFINSDLTGTVNLKVSMGEFISSQQRRIPFFDFLSNVYGGIGLGIINNKISNVRYYDVNYYPGEDKSTEEIVPVNIGINIPMVNQWGYTRYAFNINWQTTFTFGEGMDGYTPVVGKNDMYSFLSAGVKLYFGPMGLDKRR
ncbi:MAG: outer membrane beta-barrel protein [Pedobacter sp.]|nr:outer membrane beta-barrel protein [Pedobacter sp.]